ncbi:MAG: FtsB family cell division protein [Planctomycetota bacterium]|jgi:cell division protein FtsB
MNRLLSGFPWFPESIIVVLLVTGVGVLLTNIVPTRGQLARLREDKERLREEVRLLEDQQRRLETYAEALENDPQSVERALRKTFRLTRPGEKVLRFEEDGEPADEGVLPEAR